MSNEKIIKAGIEIKANADVNGVRPLSEEIQTATKNINNLNDAAQNLGDLFQNASQQEAVKMLQDIENHAEAACGELENVAGSWVNLEKITGSAGLSMAVAAATQFEHNFAKMAHSVTGTSEQMSLLKQQIKDLSNEMGVAAADIMNVASAAAGFGVATEDLAKFSEIAIQMGKVFGVAGEEVAQSLANIQKAFQFENTEQLQKFADNLAQLGEVANASEDEMLGVVDAVSTAAHQFGLSANETTALASAFLALGRSPSEASKSIKTLLQKLATAETQSAGFQAALENIGLSANQLAQDIREKPQAALNEFLQTIKGLDETTQANVLQDLFGDNVGTQIQAVVANLGEYQTALNAVANEQSAAGRLAEKYGEGMQTLIGELAKLKNTVQNTLATMGDALLPIITTGVKGLNEFASAISWVTKTFPNLTRLAVLFGTARVAINAVEIATKKWSLNTIKSLKDIGLTAAKEMGIISGSLKTAAASAKELSGNLKEVGNTGLAGAKADVADFVDNIGNIGAAFKKAAGIAAAAFASWDIGSSIGKSLYENSDVAAAFGDWLGKGIAYIDAALTERTVEDVQKHYKTKAEMTAELAREERQAAARQAELEQQKLKQLEQQKQKVAELKQEYQEVTDKINAQVASLELVDGKGALYEQIQKQIEELTLRQTELSEAIADNGQVMTDLAGGSDKVKQALSGLGLSLFELKTGISETSQKVIDDFATAAAAVGFDAENMAVLFNATLSKIGDSSPAIEALTEKLQAVGDRAGLTSSEIEEIAAAANESADSVADAFSKLGVDIDAVHQGISSSAKRAFEAWADASNEMANAGKKDALVIQAAFDNVFSKLKTTNEFEAFKQQLNASSDAALLTAEQTQKLQDAIDGVSEKTGQLSQSTDEFSGVATDSYQNATSSVQEYGKAVANAAESTGELGGSLNEAGGGAGGVGEAISAYATAIAKAGGASDEAVPKIKKLAAVHMEGEHSAQSIFKYFDYVRRYTESYAQKTEAAAQSLQELNAAMNDGTVSMKNISSLSLLVGNGLKILDEQTLSSLRSAIDSARQKLEELQNASRNTRIELEREFASLTGNVEKVQDMEQKAKIKALQEKLDIAQKGGDQVQIEEYSRALKLQKDIGDEKKRQAEEQKIQAEIAEQEKKKQEREKEKNQDVIVSKKDKHVAGVDFDLSEKVEVGNIKGLAGDLARQIGETLNQREKMIVERALKAFSNEIKDALKRSAR